MHLPALKPKQLFLIDGIGALLSAFLLAVVLVKYEYFFGIPRYTLYFLAIFPLYFAVIDIMGYLSPKSAKTFLKVIAFSNLAYCLLSLGMATYHHQSLSLWGWVYIVVEVAIVLFLAIVELKAATR